MTLKQAALQGMVSKLLHPRSGVSGKVQFSSLVAGLKYHNSNERSGVEMTLRKVWQATDKG